MKLHHWKIATFASLSVAAFLAIHPLSKQSSGAEGPKTPKHQNGFLASLFGGPSDDATPEHHVGTKLQALWDAKTSTQVCEAVNAFGMEAAGDEEATTALGERTTDKYPIEVRNCSIRALRGLSTASARSWLGDLLNDKDPDIRERAIAALAEDTSPEARRMLLGVAHSPDVSDRQAALIALGNQHVAEAGPMIIAEIGVTTDYQKESWLVEALGASGSPDAGPYLLRMAQTAPTTVRTSALEALGHIGGDGAASLLEQTLKGGNHQDVQVAANALARIGDPRARQVLLAAATDARHSVAAAALHGLAQLDGPDVRQVMAQSLSSSDREIAGAAIQYFSERRDDTSVTKLGEIAVNGAADVRGQAVTALRSIGTESARTALESIAAKPGPMQADALGELQSMPGGEKKARDLAIALVRDHGGQNATAALDVLAKDNSPEARAALADTARSGTGLASAAIGVLGQNADAESMRVLSDLAAHAKTKELRIDAVRALGSTGDPKAVSTLLATARDDDPHMKRAALLALEHVGGADAERAITDATRSTDVGVRAYAVNALGRMGTSSSEQQLERLAQDKDNNLARVALQTLATSAPQRAASFVDRAMQSTDPQTRTNAITAASNLDGATAKRVALMGVKDPDANVASAAITQLADLGGPEAQSALVDVLTSRTASEDTKREAADALDAIGGDASRRFHDLIDKYKSGDEAENETLRSGFID